MAITNSAKKALRRSLRRKETNAAHKNRVRKITKQLRTLIAQQKKEEAKKLLPQFFSLVDKAAKVGVIKKGAAARKKSRVSVLLAKI